MPPRRSASTKPMNMASPCLHVGPSQWLTTVGFGVVNESSRGLRLRPVRMATLGIEEITENAIRAVARDCGSLSIECSDVAGYVEGVAERIGEHLKVLDALEEVTTRLLADQARVSRFDRRGAAAVSEQAKAKLEAGREAIEGTIAGFKGLTELVVQLGERMAGFAVGDEPGPDRLLDDRDDRPQDQHAGARTRPSRRPAPAMPAAASRWSPPK